MDRFAWDNLAAAALVVTPSGEQPGFPVRNLRDPLRSLAWRSPLGHTIGPFNDRLDFTRVTPFAAALTHGTYATPADIAAHVAARMNVEDANTYTVTPVGARFTIAGAAAFDLDVATGPNKARSVALDLGHFDVADKTGLTSYAGDEDVHQSRSWIVFDLGETKAFQRGTLLEHNLSAATVLLEANDTDAWTAPAFSQALAVAGELRIADFAQQTRRYLRLAIDDRANADAFTRIGVAFVGPYTEPSRKHAIQERHALVGPSTGIRAAQGALHQERKQQGNGFAIAFTGLTDADKTALEAMGNDVRSGGALFWSRNAPSDLADTHYVELLDIAFARQPDAPDRWVLGLDLPEALG